MSKQQKTTAKAIAPQPATIAPPVQRRRRRRRRRSNQLLSQRLVTEVNQKKRQFLREVSSMLTDALGFPVRVTLVRPKIDLSADMRRAARMTKAQSRRQIADSMGAPIIPGKPKAGGGGSAGGGAALLGAMLKEPVKRPRARKPVADVINLTRDEVGI